MTAAILGTGIQQIIFPESFPDSKLQFMLNVISPGLIAVYCVVVGWVRGAALLLNGKIGLWGTTLRAVTAALTGTLWAQMGISLIIAQTESGRAPSPSLVIYGVLVLSELDAVGRALSDARFR